MIRRVHAKAKEVVRLHWKRTVLLVIGGLLVPFTIAQLLYPTNTLLPFTTIDGQNMSGWNKSAAIERLNAAYSQEQIHLYFGTENQEPYRSPKPADIGITIANEERIGAMNYPWYLRIAPGSLLWGHLVVQPSGEPLYTRGDAVLSNYIETQLEGSCVIEPRDASIKVENNELKVERGFSGGTCKEEDIQRLLSEVHVNIASKTRVDVPLDVIPATVDNTEAEELAAKLSDTIQDGIPITLGSETFTLPREQLVSWLDFAVSVDGIDYNFNADRANAYLNEQFASKVASPAGITKITTYDFVETSRQTGASGRALDTSATLATIKDYIAGTLAQPSVKTQVTAPTVQYTRSYSPTYEGLAALMKNYATSHPGTYGVALIELSGQYRRASYSGSQQFTTASTYKLFVAYSTLLRIESGAWKWSDQVHGGRDLSKCFDDMIVLSDNECAHTLLEKIGFTNITNEARAIGCVNTSFLGSDGIKTTADDLALLLAQLQTGQILRQQSSRDTLINAMKRNIYRQGIPKGVSGTVADKVGFLDGLLHDAAIVYSTTGPYVLVILTDGSSWANIAELTRQLEAQRLQ